MLFKAIFATLAVVSTVAAVAAGGTGDSATERVKPNIVFIFTDDQDARMDSLSFMPNVQKHLVEQGTLYRNHYATAALCCPSRVSLLRGQCPHNTKVTGLILPHGGYNKFNLERLGEDYLPLWMKKAGYSNYFIGKMMNDYNIINYNKPTPAGFDYQDQLVDPYTYVYNNAVFSRNGQPPVYYKNTYQTDAIHAKALATLRCQRGKDKPFFLWLAPTAPHSQSKMGPQYGLSFLKSEPPVPASRHAHLFKNVKIPRTPNFNPANRTKTASYWKLMDRLNETEVAYLDEAYRQRLRALQAVDEMVGSVIEELEIQGKLDSTYIVFSTDNGYHLGQHRAYSGKTTDIEEDINIPLVVRGPGVAKDHVSDIVSAHHDLAPTFLALAGGDDYVPDWVDGGVIPWTDRLRSHPKPVSKESFAEDPYELYNIYGSSEATTELIDRLDALLSVLKTCHDRTCRDPWRLLHPSNNDVQTLADALDEKYDVFYRRMPKVSYKECLSFYLPLNEDPPYFEQQTTASLPSSRSLQQCSIFKPDDTKCKLLPQIIESLEDQSMSNEEVQRLISLVPQPSQSVGHHVPSEVELKERENPLPKELLEAKVNWSKYGFYGLFGN
ncbi:alkaline-phosphatase-like protein [Zychaea mexicana]|uniref:alkaline-phosphatase-like protein n=1 Tax=Zychaea mexicana TaxID=64656 RepID=UPI0022FE038A|nr:alkaline-phosphatase-like protein [Zychaea mexicana]KAI9493124.1 alkaline-phosphatase-like protein [Zychaea mexicana]